MTNEEKQLLLKDLCARLPYETIVRNYATDEDDVLTYSLLDDFEIVGLEHIKPYLRSMSSMTEEEAKDMNLSECLNSSFYVGIIDWLNAHHFDYRGLIEKGLALEAPKGMYK